MAKRLSHEERQKRRAEAVQQLKRGVSPAELSHKYKLSVNYLLLLAGLRRPRQMPVRAFQVVAALQNEPDTTGAEIARRLGISQQRVCAIAQEAERCGVRFFGRRRQKSRRQKS